MVDLDDLFGPPGPREPFLGGVQCKHCKAWGLKWRQDSDRWRLYEIERVHPGNYMPEHHCPTTVEDMPSV